MYIIAGLGNPGKEYAHTRHNVGFDTIDLIADRYDISVDLAKFSALIGKGIIEGKKVILLKPMTYMNLSGEAIRAVTDYFKTDIEKELIIIYDDIYLDAGRLRLRKAGSAGGHNGMKNIIAALGTESFMRVRIGVGEKPKGYDLKDYVLSHFTDNDRDKMDEALIRAANSVVAILKDGIDKAMNVYNKSEEEQEGD
ncbi:MAG: aminoacyl-tRNA hydrolase [Lachnospiraceae bacterium]|nr:aminoacyl-tRNA hydrolase [Lachnospiraceae bacterium]